MRIKRKITTVKGGQSDSAGFTDTVTTEEYEYEEAVDNFNLTEEDIEKISKRFNTTPIMRDVMMTTADYLKERNK